jgi:hypothetical protein
VIRDHQSTSFVGNIFQTTSLDAKPLFIKGSEWGHEELLKQLGIKAKLID